MAITGCGVFLQKLTQLSLNHLPHKKIQNVTYLVDGVFTEIIKLKCDRQDGCIQYDQYPYKKRKSGHRHTEKEDNMKTQAENGHL